MRQNFRLALFFGVVAGGALGAAQSWGADCRHEYADHRICHRIVTLAEYQHTGRTQNRIELFLETDRQGSPKSIQYIKNGGIGDFAIGDGFGAPYYIFQQCDFSALINRHVCELDPVTHSVNLTLSGFGQTSATRSPQPVEQASGGSSTATASERPSSETPEPPLSARITVSYLFNGLTGSRREVSYVLQRDSLSRQWSLYDGNTLVRQLGVNARYNGFLRRNIGISSVYPIQ